MWVHHVCEPLSHWQELFPNRGHSGLQTPWEGFLLSFKWHRQNLAQGKLSPPQAFLFHNTENSSIYHYEGGTGNDWNGRVHFVASDLKPVLFGGNLGWCHRRAVSCLGCLEKGWPPPRPACKATLKSHCRNDGADIPKATTVSQVVCTDHILHSHQHPIGWVMLLSSLCRTKSLWTDMEW